MITTCKDIYILANDSIKWYFKNLYTFYDNDLTDPVETHIIIPCDAGESIYTVKVNNTALTTVSSGDTRSYTYNGNTIIQGKYRMPGDLEIDLNDLMESSGCLYTEASADLYTLFLKWKDALLSDAVCWFDCQVNTTTLSSNFTAPYNIEFFINDDFLLNISQTISQN